MPGALAKSMKDNFVHCRIAGLKTAIACIKLIDVQQLATKIIPQVAILLLDKHNDVRAYSLSLMDASMERMRSYNEHLLQSSKEASSKDDERRASVGGGIAAPTSGGGGGATSGAGGGAGGNNANGLLGSPMLESWTSWGIQGISKTLDMDAGNGPDKRIGEISVHSAVATPQPAKSKSSSSTAAAIDSSSNHNNLDDSEHFFEARSFPAEKTSTAAATAAGSWGDDDLDSALRFDDDDMGLDDSNNGFGGGSTPRGVSGKQMSSVPGGGATGTLGGTSSTHSSTSTLGIPSSASIPKVSSFGSDGSSHTGSAATTAPKIPAGMTSSSKKKAEKVAVKKLEFSKEEDWEDF